MARACCERNFPGNENLFGELNTEWQVNLIS